MAFKSGSYQQLTTIPTSPHDDLYMFLDSSQNGVFDSDTGITSSTTAPTRITRSNGIRFAYGGSSLHKLAIGHDRLVIMQQEWSNKADSDAFFHIYNLGYYNTQTDSGVLTVLKDSTLTEFQSYYDSATHDNLSSIFSVQSNTEFMYDTLRMGNDRIVISGSDYTRGMAGIYDLKGKLIKFLYKDKTTDSKTSGRFGFSCDVGSGRILVGDETYMDSNADSIGACFMYDLNGNHIKTIRPPSGYTYDGIGGAAAQFAGNVRVNGASIVISQDGFNDGVVGGGVVHIYDLNGNHKHAIRAQSNVTQYGHRIDAKDGIIAIQGTTLLFSPLRSATFIDTYNHNGSLIGSSRDVVEDSNQYGSPQISDGRIIVENRRDYDSWDRLAILTKETIQIQNVLPPTHVQDAGTGNGEYWARTVAAGGGKIAVGMGALYSTYISSSDSGYDDSASGVYLFDIPKQKNLTNLLDDF